MCSLHEMYLPVGAQLLAPTWLSGPKGGRWFWGVLTPMSCSPVTYLALVVGF